MEDCAGLEDESCLEVCEETCERMSKACIDFCKNVENKCQELCEEVEE
jgi:hypothetical protein